MAEIPQQLQDQLTQLQTLQQQLQLSGQQRQQIEYQIRESQRAMEELEKATDSTPVYRNVGALLVRTAGPAAVKKELLEDQETLQVRLKTFEKAEGRLKEKVTELQSKVQAGLKTLSGPGGRIKPSG